MSPRAFTATIGEVSLVAWRKALGPVLSFPLLYPLVCKDVCTTRRLLISRNDGSICGRMPILVGRRRKKLLRHDANLTSFRPWNAACYVPIIVRCACNIIRIIYCSVQRCLSVAGTSSIFASAGTLASCCGPSTPGRLRCSTAPQACTFGFASAVTRSRLPFTTRCAYPSSVIARQFQFFWAFWCSRFPRTRT